MAQSYEGPKQLLPVAGKPLVEHTLAALPEAVDELVLVVGGPYEQQIRDYFGPEHRGRKITYARQPEPKGLGHAIQQARDIVRGRFLVFLPDDLYVKEDLERLVREEDLAALAQRVPDPRAFGVFVSDSAGCIARTVEKPQEFVSDLVSTGVYLLDGEFFAMEVPPSRRGEIELPDIINALVWERGRRIRIVEATFWCAVNNPEQLVEAEAIMRQRLAHPSSP
jgi:dTDP-glucose pyrophosphorylase